MSLPTEALSAVGRVESDDLAVVDDGDALGVLHGLFFVHVVGGEEDGDALFRDAGGGCRPQMRARVCGSRPTVGSSRNSTRGVWSIPRRSQGAVPCRRVGGHEYCAELL